MAAQLALFETTQVDTTNLMRLMASEDRRNAAIAFAIIKNQGVSITEMLIKAIKEHWERDWLKAWDGLENTGYMTFVNFNFGYRVIEIIEKDCTLSFNGIELYQVNSDTDEFNDKLTRKYIRKVTTYIRSHAKQVEYLIKSQES